MGELSEFHPDQLSNLEDIQEALNKLVGAELQDDTDMSMSTVDDVDVVDHEVTIGQDQEDMDISTLPDIPDMENRHQEITDMLEDNLEIGQTITIEAPPVPVEKKMVPIKPAMTVPVSFPQLKTIRPLPEALKGKRPGSFNLTSVKKSVLTKVIFTPNTQNNISSDSPILIGESGGQAIRIIGQNKNILNSPRTITLAQAREMGLKLSPGKVQQIIPHQQRSMVRQSIMMDPSKTYAMVKSSPTKILPLPSTGQLQHIAPSNQRFIIRHSPGVKTGSFANTFLTNATSSSQGQILQFPSQDGLSSQIHQIQLPGQQKVQYVRLVTTTPPSAANNAGVGLSTVEEPPPPPTIIPAPTPPTTPATSQAVSEVQLGNSSVKMLQLASKPTTNAAQTTNSFERVLVSPGLSQLSAKSDTKPTANNMVMVPSEFIKHYKPPPVPSPPSPTKPAPASVPLLTKAKEVYTPKETFVPLTAPQRTKSSESHNGLRPRKPCNCTKSQCLKLYCDCFANGEFCFQCNCNCCYNNLDHEEERQRAIKSCLERNPNAFRPKIGKGYVGDERRHNKGCNCKRSGCLKNYCECYEAKIPCSNNCKCVGCRNVEDARDKNQNDGSKTSLQNSLKNKLSSEIQEIASRSNNFSNQGTRQPFNLMTQEVVEATCQCLLAVEGDTKSQVSEQVERLILEEFGRCLVQIIDCASRTTVNSNT
ncbi:protein lin-54 homolog isoform X2 [Macrosteles quadrilineatus]|nr:protein lin-54 homolog isoform X2 [Macrosteles quadrilineatus]